jgi:hypothetical protein
LRELPRAEWPKGATTREPRRVWVSRDFLVAEHAEEHVICRLSINRTSVVAGGGWRDGITWDELQELKRQVGYGDAMAVEVYPPDADVVNVANIRHLFVVHPEAVPFAWRRR